MIITRRLIQDFFDISKISDLKISNVLNLLGYEVVKYKNIEIKNRNIVLARIINFKKLKDTNHLNLVTVMIDKNKTTKIICGANNLKENMYVLYAMPSAKLSCGLEIKPRLIKGYNSNGMLCSFKELGFNSQYFDKLNKGIVEVISKYNNDDFLGKNILKDLGFYSDSCFEYDITLNRNYGLSSLEVIKELSFFFKKNFNKINLINNNSNINNNFRIYNNCNMLSNKVIKSINTIQIQINNNKLSTNKLIKYKNLELDGNHIVLIKNFVSNLFGQSIILLDLDKITLDLELRIDYEDQKNNIKKGQLVLVHNNEFVNVLGIKENKKFSITKDSKNILACTIGVDSLFFRQIQKKYNITTTDMQRYMRFESITNLDKSLLYFVNLLKNNDFLINYSKINKTNFIKNNSKMIKISSKHAQDIIGIEISSKKIKQLLEPIGFKCKIINKEDLEIDIPEIRNQINDSFDIFEEIIRLYNYDLIEPIRPASIFAKKDHNYKKINIEWFRQFLLNNGFNHVKTFSLTNKKEIENFNFFNLDQPFSVKSPLNEKHQLLRLSLINSLIKILKYNYNHGLKNLKIFNIEKIYYKSKDSNLPLNSIHLAGLTFGKIINHKISNSNINNSFYYLKGIVESIFDKFNYDKDKIRYKNLNNFKTLNEYESCKIYYNNNFIGIIGSIHPSIFIHKVYCFELDLSKLFKKDSKPIIYKEQEKYNSIVRDITISLTSNDNFQEKLNNLTKNLNYLKQVKVIDCYYPNNLDKTKYQLTISFVFNSSKFQLTDKIIKTEIDKLSIKK